MKDARGDILFSEVQRFRQPWLWLIVAGVAGLSIWSFVQQIVLGKEFGQNPAPNGAVIVIALIFGLGFPALFYSLNLSVRVTGEGLEYRFFPLHLAWQRIPSVDILRHEAVTYSPLRDYGGWGIRYGRGGKAYNVSGKRGVMLELSGGARIVFGSQRADEMDNAIDALVAKRPRAQTSL